MNTAGARTSMGVWVLAVGGTGFAAGFIGPVLLNPEANQGPLLGIFITGPGGALAGLVLGVLARVLPLSAATRRTALLLACSAILLTTLWFCLPRPALLGYVIDGEIEECVPATQAADTALAHWQQAVARTTWATPPADWQQTALRNLASDGGVVLTVRLVRRAAILQHRRPWDRGRRFAGAWSASAAPERYYAHDRGAACDAYLGGSRQLYWPFSEGAGSPERPATVWPPTDPAGFLSLQQLGNVPEEYWRLLP